MDSNLNEEQRSDPHSLIYRAFLVDLEARTKQYQLSLNTAIAISLFADWRHWAVHQHPHRLDHRELQRSTLTIETCTDDDEPTPSYDFVERSGAVGEPTSVGPELPASASQVSSGSASASQVSASQVSAMSSGSASALSTELGGLATRWDSLRMTALAWCDALSVSVLGFLDLFVIGP